MSECVHEFKSGAILIKKNGAGMCVSQGITSPSSPLFAKEYFNSKYLSTFKWNIKSVIQVNRNSAICLSFRIISRHH